MKTIKLEAKSREILGKKVAALRTEGLIPAVVYGHSTEAKSISVNGALFEKVYREAGESSLLDLVIDSAGAVKALIKEVQVDPLTDRTTHIDFHAVTMTEKLNATIPLTFVGEPKAVKGLGGTLVKNVSEIDVRCLPSDLMSAIEVDLSPLATFEDSITLADIALPKGMEAQSTLDMIIATVMPPISEAELKALEEKPVEDVSAVEKVEEKKKEEEHGKDS
ncbi:50S ribosomal protein L25 [Candidatus Uhrbacteria bacterium]|nr:50S ribosomal protein L25 [Candidatus Uhrbacteria bacterium]